MNKKIMAQLNWSNKSIIATLHFLVWAMLFILPYYLTGSDPDPFFLKNTWVSLALFGIAFYANYFFLIDRFFWEFKNDMVFSFKCSSGSGSHLYQDQS